MPFEHLTAALQGRRENGLYRSIAANKGGAGACLHLDGRDYLNFASNDYLGLAGHAEVIAAWQQGAKRYGVGSGGSQLVTGYSEAHQQLATRLQALTGFPAVLLFSSGFAANCGVLNTLMGKGDLILQDRLNHASLLDGGLQSPAAMQRFAHNDVADLSRRLHMAQARQALVVTEGVFSMDGDCAPLEQIAGQCAEHGAALMVDDAHGFGLGLYPERPAEQGIDLYMATFGKAIGVGGAFIACAQAEAEYLVNFCRHYIYTTAIPPAQAVAIVAALDLLEHSDLRSQLRNNIRYFRDCAQAAELPLLPSESAIQPLMIGESETALRISARLRQLGLWVTAIRPPTVPPHTARLRITLSAAHSRAQIEQLVAALSTIATEELPHD